MRHFFCLIVFFQLVVFVPIGQARAQAEQQRLLYTQAKAALDAGDSSVYRKYQQQLKDYILLPYLSLAELRLRLEDADSKEVERFLVTHGDLPQIRMLMLDWLRLLAKQGSWPVFSRHYSSELNFVELDCWNAQLQLQQNNQQAAFDIAEHLWRSSLSRPNACDPVFAAWHEAGLRTDAKVWDRLLLAVEDRSYGLARYLANEYKKPELAQQLISIAQNPELIKNKQNFTRQDQQTRNMVSIGLRRLFRQDAETALNLLPYYHQQLDFPDEEKVIIARDIGVILAKRFDPRAFQVFQQWDPEHSNEQVAQWNARLQLRLGQWSQAQDSIQTMPDELTSSNRWRYWSIRSQQALHPQESAATEQYKQLARERDFYGFMAADRSQSAYALNHSPLQVSPETIAQVRNTRGIQRAFELDALGDFTAAQREWQHASRLFSHQQILAQARLAAEKDWHNPAIRNLAQAQYWDDLDIRFPLAYRDTLVNAARQQGIQPSWAYAITRQESAFLPTAGSHAGAMGLMQLMPGTARDTARRYSIELTSTQQALNPETNIQLGTAYLNQMMQQFNGNRILASAAYNAGPGRIRQWTQNADSLPYDIWIETIPFDETRQYVQNVLTYSVIYGDKLDAPTRLVEWHEQQLD